jgi:dihydrofolate reductase
VNTVNGSVPPAKSIKLVLVAAVAENGVIGRDNALPWRMKSDLKHFRDVTTGRPVVMGRKTFESIGTPLKNRTNIVISRNVDFGAPGVTAVQSLETALAVARADALRRGATSIAVIGGSGVFADGMALADVLEITVVHMTPQGDTFFPSIDTAQWRETARQRHAASAQDDADFTFVTYER